MLATATPEAPASTSVRRRERTGGFCIPASTIREERLVLNPTETEANEGHLREGRLQELRQTVGDGLPRSLSWRQAQLDGLLRFLSDHEEAMLAALKADLGRCAAEARLADVLMVRSELRGMRLSLRRWLRPRYVSTPLAGQPGRSWVEPEPF